MLHYGRQRLEAALGCTVVGGRKCYRLRAWQQLHRNGTGPAFSSAERTDAHELRLNADLVEHATQEGACSVSERH